MPENNQLSIIYLIDPDPRGSMGLGGRQAVEASATAATTSPRSIRRPAKIAWRHKLPGGGGPTGMLTTAGGLLFAGDGAAISSRSIAANGKPLWHSRIGNVSNAPQTYMLDGKQYVLAAAGDALFAFALY